MNIVEEEERADVVYLLALILRTFSIEDLQSVAKKCLVKNEYIDKDTLVESIINTEKWSIVLNTLEINDFRICSKCGSLMHQGFCYDMGKSYYCSEECLHKDFTLDEWIYECEIEDQSYWTDWFEHYNLTKKQYIH